MTKKIPVLSNKAKFRRNKTEWMLLTPNGKLLELNDVGKFVLELCDGSKTIDQITTIVNDVLDTNQSKEETYLEIENFLNEVKKTLSLEIFEISYKKPEILLRTSSGIRRIGDIEQEYWDGPVHADPPCQ